MLLTEFINFLSINVFWVNNQMNQIYQNGKFDLIKKVENAKINNLHARSKGSKVVNINKSNKLLYEIEYSQISYEEALKRIENIRSDIDKPVSA